jgi:cell division protein FtsZ
MIEFNHKQQIASQTADQVAIKVVGLGGAGLNVIDRIILDGDVPGAELVVMNTDVQSLTSSVASQKVQIGRNVTRGLGTGGDPELGYAAAHEAQEDIRAALEGASLIFLCTGLGGGTGSGAVPLVASLAKENGALVVVIATMPFTFEGKRRAAQAAESLALIQATADAVICFDNDLMGDAVSPKAGIHQAFAAADETISQCVRAVAGLFTQPGILHIGFDELCAALRPGLGGAGRCLFGYGEAEGDNRAHEALTRALRNPLMDRGRMLDDSHNLLVNVAGGPDMTLNEVQMLMGALTKHTDDDTHILFGTAVDPTLAGRMCVTMISSTDIASDIAANAPAHEFVPRVVPAPMHLKAPAPIVHAAPEPVIEQPAAIIETPAPIIESPIEIPAPYEPAEVEQVAAIAEPIEAIAPEPIIEPYFETTPEPVAAFATSPDQDHQPSFIDITPAPQTERPAAELQPVRVPRVPRQPRILATTVDPTPQPAASRREERQETLQFEPVTRGRFEKSEPTIVDGQDLDVPTFLRRNVKVS